MRRKKEIEITSYIPNKYQEKIYDWVIHGSGNLVIEAAAGAGKTTTIINAMNLIDKDKKILFCAFNKDIVTELKKKVGDDHPNIDIKTVHSLGLSLLQRNFPTNKFCPPNLTKYYSYIATNLSDIASFDLRVIGSKINRYKGNLILLTDYCRYNLAQTKEDAEMLAEKHGLEIVADECEAVYKVLEWGKNNLDSIDYTDMIWLPNVLYLGQMGLRYDYIMIDEAQDISIAQREFILKCTKLGTRIISCGDKNQTLYSFLSADRKSFEVLQSLPNTITLPLSISYRCPKNIVNFARKIVPTIEWNEENKIDGEIEYNSSLDEIQDGDMVLCRNNAPLMKVYTELVNSGKNCFIRGKDIGKNLIKVVENTKQKELNKSLLKDGVFARLYNDLFETRDKIMVEQGVDEDAAMFAPIIQSKLDSIRALELISCDVENNTDKLIEKLNTIFVDKGKSKKGIAISTIHKAKGLEADNVYIACRSLMPSKSAKKDWEIEQEKNIMYVAYTRAKKKLSFLSEDEFKDMVEIKTQNLARIENQINKVLGKSRQNIITSSTDYKKSVLTTPTYKIRSKEDIQNLVNNGSLFGLRFNKKQVFHGK